MTTLAEYENPDLFDKSKGKNPSYFRKNKKAMEPMGLTNHKVEKKNKIRNVKIIGKVGQVPLELPDYEVGETKEHHDFSGAGEAASVHVQQPLELAKC